MNKDLKIMLKVNPKDIAFINKIFEGYDGLAIVTTNSVKEGLITISVTPETKEDVLEILRNFPKPVLFKN